VGEEESFSEEVKICPYDGMPCMYAERCKALCDYALTEVNCGGVVNG
jgi:hypothetical protein